MRNKLPAEVLIILFNYINYKDLFACQKVCNEWCSPARILIYKCITLDDASRRDSFLSCLLRVDPSLGKLVKCIDFSGTKDSMVYIGPNHLKQLAKLCPAMERLLGVDTYPYGGEFWKACYFTCIKYWTHIEQLPSIPANYTQHVEQYLTTAIACRKHLEVLELWQIHEKRNPYWTENMTHLIKTTFHQLKSLKLGLFSYRDTVYSFDLLLNQCPKLTKLEIDYRGIYRSIQHNTRDDMDLSNIAPVATLQKLSISKGRINMPTINYVKHKFPQLSSINLSFGLIPIETDFTDTEITEMFQYAMNIERAHLEMSCSKFARIVGLFSQHVKQPIISLSIIYHERASSSSSLTPTRLVMKKYTTNDTNEQKKTRENKPLYYTAEQTGSRIAYSPLPSQQQQEPAQVIAYCQRSTTQPTLPPHTGMLLSIGPQLNYLYMDLQQYDILNGSGCNNGTSATGPECRLDTIFRLCPSLHTLAFSARYLLECDETFTCNTFIKHLAIFGTEISDGIFPQLSTRLPALECLQLTGCHIYDVVKNDASNSIDMPYTSFRCLSITEKHDSARHHPNPQVVYIDYFSRLYLMTQTSFLELSTMHGEKYFKLEKDKAMTVPLQTCRNAKPELTKFHLRCKSIKSLRIQKGGLNIVDLKPDMPPALS